MEGVFENPDMKEFKTFTIGFDFTYGNYTPMKRKMVGHITVEPGTVIMIELNNESQNIHFNFNNVYPENTEKKTITLDMRDVEPYPNVNFRLGDKFILPGNGVTYAQQVKLTTNASRVECKWVTFVDM
jgi:hypothetical protein